MQYHVIPSSTMQYRAIPCNTMQYHAMPCNAMQYHAIPCNTMQFHATQCNTMQYHAKPCTINNCWRSVPLPCGQYKAIFFPQRLMARVWFEDCSSFFSKRWIGGVWLEGKSGPGAPVLQQHLELMIVRFLRTALLPSSSSPPLILSFPDL